ncbi:energy-coupled thiamine transporter ThiT [Streptococcus australis]|uniref:energy-coupled thiamine transporter ThiT n=1 Tax=Streptococcus australis TaxID=113107 RepID=UPI001CBE8641|nr:energy-coupled thiamine transporter ThiT [Streptococcus australis]MBZ2158870.1 energy-coupled thiamine transporter ThiT [Streptococcus australis]
MSKTTVRPMIEVALLATIAYILDLVTQPMSLGPWISLSFKMVPIFLLSFRWGVKAGAMGGFIWGLLQVVTGEAAGGWLTPIQGFLEYFVAFSLIGLSGTVKPALDKAIRDKKRVQTLTYITAGVVLGGLARYLIHYIAGVIFWGSYAPAGQSAYIYSLVVNSSSFLGETIASLIVFFILQEFLGRLLITEQ